MMRRFAYLLTLCLGCSPPVDVTPDPPRSKAAGSIAPCCPWTITPPVSSDYHASIGELVQVDMGGKVWPDVVTVNLPDPAGYTGQSIAVITINSGGAEDGSRLRLRAPTHIRPPGDHVCDSHNEVFQTATSAGSYWILSNSK